jgi:hypothetical protein
MKWRVPQETDNHLKKINLVNVERWIEPQGGDAGKGIGRSDDL